MPIPKPPEGTIIVSDEHPFPDDPEFRRAFSIHAMRVLAHLYAKHYGLTITGETITELEPGQKGGIRFHISDEEAPA